MVKAVFIDFYGTLVHGNGAVFHKICRKIYNTGTADTPARISAYWGNEFQSARAQSFGDTFEPQRVLIARSLEKTISRFCSSADADALCDKLFTYWRKPSLFNDARPFLKACPVPFYIISDIDRQDIEKAVAACRLSPAGIWTSEDAKAYKPRKDIFELALRDTGFNPKEVIHIGSSLRRDICGADAAGIRALWLNRKGLHTPDDVLSLRQLSDAYDTVFFKESFLRLFQ